MTENFRHSIWLVQNIIFDGNDFEEELEFNGTTIRFLITNYENLKCSNNIFSELIKNEITNYSMIHLRGNPINFSTFIITLTPYSDESAVKFTNLIRLCLKLNYFPYTSISTNCELRNNELIAFHDWESIFKTSYKSKNKIDSKSFSEVINYFNILESKNYNLINSLFEQILKISNINDITLEILCLWSFIEGFWNNTNGDSKLEKSFLNMLTSNYCPGKTKKDENIKEVTKKILDLNFEISGKRDYSKFRNILAHGEFLKLEKNWSVKQWKAITEQRELLLKVVIKSLVNHIDKNY